MKRRLANEKRHLSGKPTPTMSVRLRPEDLRALAKQSHDVAMFNQDACAERLADRTGVLSPRAVRLFRESSKDIVLAAETKATKLRAREIRILEVIRRGAKGMAYCRELDNAGLRPRKHWTNKGCRSTYAQAYRDPYWRQMIQDENRNCIARPPVIASR